MAERAGRGLPVPHLRAWRIDRILSQVDLAARSSVNRLTVARAERGERIRFTNIQKLAAGLGISPQQLVHDEPPRIAPTSSGGAPSGDEHTS